MAQHERLRDGMRNAGGAEVVSALWALLAWVLLLVCFFFMPPPNPEPGLTPVNINYVWGLSDYAAQNWVSPAVWLIGLMIGLPLLLCVPTHFLLLRLAPKPERAHDEARPS